MTAPAGAVAGTEELDLARWRESDLLTSTWWDIAHRDGSLAATGMWGGFIPQLPNQALRRYTRPGGVAVDLFGGAGTTLQECLRLGRHGLALELNPETAAAARERLASTANPHGTLAEVYEADSSDPGAGALVGGWLRAALGRADADLVVLHPPYLHAVRFGAAAACLGNAPDLEAFLAAFRRVAATTASLLAPGGVALLVIGDVYEGGRLVPLSAYCMQALQGAGLLLKGVCVKNVGETRGKGKDAPLWRYRALKHGLFVLAHEYLYFFARPAPRGRGGRARTRGASDAGG